MQTNTEQNDSKKNNVKPLKYPITSASGQVISSVPIARLKRTDLKAARKYSEDDAEQEDFLFARMTGLTLEDIANVDIADSKMLSDTFREMAE